MSESRTWWGARLLLRAAIGLLALAGFASGQEIVFASVEEARRILSVPDAYTKAMSAFDRGARLKTEREVSEREFLGA